MPLARPLSTGAGRGVAVVAVLVLAAGATTLLPGAAPEAGAQALVPYDDCSDLLDAYRDELARSATAYGGVQDFVGRGAAERASSDAAVAAAAPSAALAGESGSAPTGTNVQERGVDEPDLAKNVGDLLYVVAGDRLRVLRAGAEPELLSSYPLGEGTWGAELLVQGDRLLVLVPDHSYAVADGPASLRMPGGYGGGAVRALLLDVADPTSPRLLEELRVDGRYLSARLSGGAVRLVTASAPRTEGVPPREPYGPAEQAAALRANVAAARAVTLQQVLPRAVRRDAGGRVLAQGTAVDCSDVRYAPSASGASTLLVTTLDLERGLAAQDSTAVTTDGELVYASTDRLYVATSRWGTAPPAAAADDRPETSTSTLRDTVTTELHAFDTSSPTRTAYAGSSSVPGYVLGRWALSSHGGNLRVATTSAPPWAGGGGEQSESGVSVLAERADDLVTVGRVDGLGKGEQIKAVRYFGDLATVVTFRQTDPLYVLDLADVARPQVLGELKVPGFSTYLHPVGDDLLLGVGQDADATGRTTGVMLQTFDLSDLSKPVQVDKLVLGAGWTPVEQESRAFGWDAARRTALLPFLAYDGVSGRSSAVGVRVGTDGSLSEVGRLAVADDGSGLDRVLHDGEHVYAVGQGAVVAADADTLVRTGTVPLRR